MLGLIEEICGFEDEPEASEPFEEVSDEGKTLDDGKDLLSWSMEVSE